MKNVLIVGYGVVGHNLAKELSELMPDIYDIKFGFYDGTGLTLDVMGEPLTKKIHYDFAFICVDTPYTEEDPCDLTQVINAIKENNADIYIIKSTMLPGSTNFLRATTDKHIVFSPEYYGNTQHCNNFEFNFTILGGEKYDCLKVQQLLQQVYDARHTFHIVDSRTAELVKYMENSWIATKVSFCNQFYQIAENQGVDYETLRELFILDPRVNPSHTFVYRDKPYWNSHCLNKDVLAIAENENAELLKDVIKFNNKSKS